MIHIYKLEVNPIRENSYIVNDESGEAIFIDPGFFFDDEREMIRDYIRQEGLTPKLIICTHCHFDHVMGVNFVKNEYNLPFECHNDDAFLVRLAPKQSAMFGFPLDEIENPDLFIRDGEIIKFGNSELKAIHVSGHSPGHMVFYSEKNNALFTGDVLFHSSIGRTDLPGGNYDELIRNIKNKLLVLPDETIVYSGHGPETTIGREKKKNPFLI